MNELQFSAEMQARLAARGGGYHERAYLFVLGSVEFLQGRLDARRHVTGEELSWGCRDFAIRQFGPMARTVLEHWGVRRSEDFGRIVFTLVDVGLLVTQPGDRVEDFANRFEFAEVFGEDEVWLGASGH